MKPAFFETVVATRRSVMVGFHGPEQCRCFRSRDMTPASQYEMQILQADMRMLLTLDDKSIELFPGYAVLHTDSLATLSGWREVMQEGGRPHRLVNNLYGYRQEVNNPDW
jgi:hypothetical protein